MKKGIKIDAFVVYWDEKCEQPCEILSMYLSKKLQEHKYRVKSVDKIIN